MVVKSATYHVAGVPDPRSRSRLLIAIVFPMPATDINLFPCGHPDGAWRPALYRERAPFVEILVHHLSEPDRLRTDERVRQVADDPRFAGDRLRERDQRQVEDRVAHRIGNCRASGMVHHYQI